MNLRKALDKAKQERQEESSTELKQEPSASLRKALDKSKQEGKHESLVKNVASSRPKVSPESIDAEKQSPVYNKSRPVKLDDELVRKNRVVCFFSDSKENDIYKGIRTQIMHRMKKNQWRTLMVTSALPGEGKSLTSVNLAITFAKEKNHSVLLVDGDLRRQVIHKQLGYESKSGLIDYLADNKPLHELIVWPGIEKLSIISGGRTVKDSTELLSSTKMMDLVTEMKSRYSDRYILLESPPILSCADTSAFSPFIDAIVLVVESGRTSAEEVKKALKLIPKEKFLGFVLNKVSRYGSSKAADYYYQA